MDQAFYTKKALDYTMTLLGIDSPSGYTRSVTDKVMKLLSDMGFSPVRTRKGCVLCDLGGEAHPLCLSAHMDTLGLMVRMIKPNGRLAFTKLGGPLLNAVETENVRVYTREGKVYTGVVELCNASSHVNHEASEIKRDDKTLEVLLDADTQSKEETLALGIDTGDIICLEPRARISENGYIHSRFLDDKLSAGMLLALAEAVSKGEIRLSRKTRIFFSVYEEVGHGASSGIPQDTEDLLVVDMGCVGEEINCKETQVSICAKDSAGPYDYAMTTELVQLAKENGIDYALDVYPYYSSDAKTSLCAGLDARYALIGAGVYASHGYERSHQKGVENTMRLMEAFIKKGVAYEA